MSLGVLGPTFELASAARGTLRQLPETPFVVAKSTGLRACASRRHCPVDTLVNKEVPNVRPAV
jgi:hypothetical protein